MNHATDQIGAALDELQRKADANDARLAHLEYKIDRARRQITELEQRHGVPGEVVELSAPQRTIAASLGWLIFVAGLVIGMAAMALAIARPL